MPIERIEDQFSSNSELRLCQSKSKRPCQAKQRKSQMGAALGAIAFQLWQRGSDSFGASGLSDVFPAVPIHVSAAFTAESATFGLLGGLGIGGVALVRLLSSKQLMDCATPHPFSTGGFLLGTALVVYLFGEPDMFEEPGIDALSWVRIVLGGVLVGFGAGLGEGCTSGNGIQGLAALAKASLVFVCTFMLIGMLTASLTGTAAALGDTPVAVPEGAWGYRAIVYGVAFMCVVSRHYQSAGAFIGGATFAASLIVAGMVKPTRVISFLDVTGSSGWDPTLAYVMGGGLLVTAPGYYVLGLVEKSELEVKMWANRPVDVLLVLGAVLFGLGWGATGICPGPALVMCGTGSTKGMLFVGCMFAARYVAGIWRKAVQLRDAASRPAPAEYEKAASGGGAKAPNHLGAGRVLQASDLVPNSPKKDNGPKATKKSGNKKGRKKK